MRHVFGEQVDVACRGLEIELHLTASGRCRDRTFEAKEPRIGTRVERQRRGDDPVAASRDDLEPRLAGELGAQGPVELRRERSIAGHGSHLDAMHRANGLGEPRRESHGYDGDAGRESRAPWEAAAARHGGIGRHRSPEPISPRRHRHHESGIGRRLAQRRSHLPHAEVDPAFEVDDAVGPQVSTDLLVRDEFAGAVDEEFEQACGLRSKWYRRTVAEEHAESGVEGEGAETADLSCMQRLVSLLGVLWAASRYFWVALVGGRGDRRRNGRRYALPPTESKGCPMCRVHLLLLIVLTASACDDGIRRAVGNTVVPTNPEHVVFRFDAPPAGTEYEGTNRPGDSRGTALFEIAVVLPGDVEPIASPSRDDIASTPAGAAFLALFDFLQTPADVSAREAFVRERFAPALIERRSVEDLAGILGRLESDFAGSRIDGILDAGELRFEAGVASEQGPLAFGVEVEPEAPHRILGIMVGPMGAGGDEPPVSWDTLAQDCEAATEQGFHGAVIAIRDGEVVLDAGFGFADPAKQHPITPSTLFAIGSTPIDFTHVGILLLEQEGKLSRDDRLSKYFDGVPTDKRAITLEHLRTGRSGMIDFPNLRGVDANPDLSWIDRDEFLRRAWASELLFEPGTDERHSHFAWGMLAAVIEVVSGQDYESFVRERIFDPAGMERTGHYPLAKKFPMREVAVGLGGRVWGEVNAPPYWGPTSWLVLGSGGMVSTTGDLRRFFEWVDEGGVLGDAGRRLFGIDGVLLNEGGNDRGFVNTIGIEGSDLVIVCSNSQTEPGDFTMRFANALIRLVVRD